MGFAYVGPGMSAAAGCDDQGLCLAPGGDKMPERKSGRLEWQRGSLDMRLFPIIRLILRIFATKLARAP